MKKIIVLILVVLALVLIWTFNNQPAETLPIDDGAASNLGEGSLTTAPAPEETVTQTKEFTVIGSNFSFTPNTLEVKKGDKIRIVFKNADGFHDLKIDEFKVATKQIKAGESEAVEFTADQTGTFEYYCSVGNHRAMGMVGKLTVK